MRTIADTTAGRLDAYIVREAATSEHRRERLAIDDESRASRFRLDVVVGERVTAIDGAAID